MVKEGHDSTVRPRLQTWEFDPDSGRKYLDVWEAEGKPNFSRLFLSRIRVAKVLSVLLIPPLVIFSYEDDGKDTAITPIQRGFSSWWSAFTALDEADVRKARDQILQGRRGLRRGLPRVQGLQHVPAGRRPPGVDADGRPEGVVSAVGGRQARSEVEHGIAVLRH